MDRDLEQLPHLISLLDDPSETVQASVADALRAFGDSLNEALDSLAAPPDDAQRDGDSETDRRRRCACVRGGTAGAAQTIRVSGRRRRHRRNLSGERRVVPAQPDTAGPGSAMVSRPGRRFGSVLLPRPDESGSRCIRGGGCTIPTCPNSSQTFSTAAISATTVRGQRANPKVSKSSPRSVQKLESSIIQIASW